jgi:hypothetical protein
LPENPQEHVEIPFNNYMSTRNVEKDNFKRNFSCIPINDQRYTLPITENKKNIKK